MKTRYFDQAASSFPKAPGVGKAMADYIEKSGVNVGRGTYGRAADAELTVLETREQLKKLFHFPVPEKYVIFTPGATWGLNQILRGWLKPGDHVIVSSMEHNAVMRPLSDLQKQGISISRIPADRAGRTKAVDLLPLIRPNTKLVLVNHASNVSGTIFPLEEVSKLCREAKIPLAVDAAQTAGYLPIDFEALGLSALCVPGHKGLLGPQGIGALLLAPDFAKNLSPIVTGGTGSASDSEVQPAYLPDRFESGTLNLPGIFGLHAALDYILSLNPADLQKRTQSLTKQFLDGIDGLPIRVAGPADPREQVGVISLDFCGMDNGEVSFALEQEFGILTRCGLHCAPNAHKTLGTFPQGTVRFSFGHTATEEDITCAVAAVKQISKNIQKGGLHNG